MIRIPARAKAPGFRGLCRFILLTMRNISVSDHFSKELEIRSAAAAYAPGVREGVVHLWTGSGTRRSSFAWERFELQPGEWAELVIDVGLGKDAAGQQHCASCDLYTLNAGGVLRHSTGENPAAIERVSPLVQVEVPCPPYLEVQLDTKVTWFLRMPGDYYARAVESTVRASHPVHIAFSEFDNPQNATNGQTLPVFYALNEEQPQGWLTPEQLNGTSLLLPTEDSALKWNMWQRVVLDGQSAGTYTDKGVITFTLRNVRDAQF